jgi:hypothetical protein
VAKGDGPFWRQFNGDGQSTGQLLRQFGGRNNSNRPPKGNKSLQQSNDQSAAKQSNQQGNNQQGQAAPAQPRLRKLFKTPVPFQNGNTGIGGSGQAQPAPTQANGANPAAGNGQPGLKRSAFKNRNLGINGSGQPQGTPAVSGNNSNGGPKSPKWNRFRNKSQAGNVAASQNQQGPAPPIKNFSIPNPVDVASDAADAVGDVATSVADRVDKVATDAADYAERGARVFTKTHNNYPGPYPHSGDPEPPSEPLDPFILDVNKSPVPDGQVDYGGAVPGGNRAAQAFPAAGLVLPGAGSTTAQAKEAPSTRVSDYLKQNAPPATGGGNGPAAPAPTGPVAQGRGRGGFPIPFPLPQLPSRPIPSGGGASVPVDPVVVSAPAPSAEVPVQYNEPAAPAPVRQTAARPVVVETAKADLVLEDLEYVEAPTLFVGPAYRVKFRNQGSAPTDKFHVALVAGLGDQMNENSPQAFVEVEGLASGQIGEATIRLPRTSLKLSGANGQPTVFTHLLVAIDADDTVKESDESNNDATVERAALETASN